MKTTKGNMLIKALDLKGYQVKASYPTKGEYTLFALTPTQGVMRQSAFWRLYGIGLEEFNIYFQDLQGKTEKLN